MRNLVATRPGSDPTGTLVLATHIDSVPHGPGAADAGVGLAVILETVRATAPTVPQQQVRASLARFLFRGALAERQVAGLSGGERFRVALATVLLADPAPQLVVLDEPTNSLDVESVDQLVDALAAYAGALLVVSHDETFLERIGITRRWGVAAGRLEGVEDVRHRR